jgi:hypothetical protein
MYYFVSFLLVAIVLWMVARRYQKSPTATKNRIFFKQVHGIRHKNDDGSSRHEIIGRCCEGEELVLVSDPTNLFDHCAVKICRKNGEQLGYWRADRRVGRKLTSGRTYRVTIDEIYPFKANNRMQGVRLRVEVMTMRRKTEERKERAATVA